MRRDDNYPRPYNDPAGDGIPEAADDDGKAFDEVDSTRVVDGPDSMALPPDREDPTEGIDGFGTTAAEQLRGESLDQRLAREMPDPDPNVVADGDERRLMDEATRQSATEQTPTDADVLDEDPVDPHLDSPVSMYERMAPDPQTQGLVGRVVEPDEGSWVDDEADSLAYDAGASGGGASAEEIAMHELSETENVPEPPG